MTDVAHPPHGEARAWTQENIDGRTRAGEARVMWDASLLEAAACLAYQAGWRRGWCAARGLPYPDGLRAGASDAEEARSDG
jgi:hypothetical protein